MGLLALLHMAPNSCLYMYTTSVALSTRLVQGRVSSISNLVLKYPDLFCTMDDTACRTQEHCAGHVACMGSPKHTSPFCQDSSCGMLTEDFSVRFSWSAQERTAKATTNTPGFCHQKGCMMDTAQQIVTQLAHGDFAAVEQRLADRIKPFIPVGTIQATWQGLEQQYGAFQGSGPSVRDETIPPNKPFRDLAWGLASQGIAVLRYEKRTKVYAAQLGNERDTLTVKEEVIDDALEAVALLHARPEIDAQQIFVLGHSLGGYLAPRLGAADPQIRGLIILAGSARPLEDLILDQMTYVLSLSMPDPAVRQQQLAVVKKQVELVKDPKRLPTAKASDLPLGVPAAYWLDLNAYQPEKVAQTLKQPMLFLLGGSDYQVTREDFQIWQGALGGRSDVQFKMYPGLSHLFMPVEGGQKATPATYTVAGHVAEEVVNEIGSWIKRISRLPPT